MKAWAAKKRPEIEMSKDDTKIQGTMTDTASEFTYVLLPSARVAVFSKDPETLAAARAIETDWRFARVDIGVHEGSIETASEIYRDEASPEMVIIQIEKIEDSLTRKLESLAEHCAEGTAAIIIGPVNDVNLYRRLIDMGVSDYLVKPTSTGMLAEVIARTLIEKLGVTGSRLIAFAGTKGGVGTSVLAQAMACGTADLLGQKTVLLDGAGGWSTMGVGLGFEPSTTLAEAARAASRDDEDSLKRMLFKSGEKLSVLASGGEIMLEPVLAPAQMEELIDTLMITYPVVIVDLSHTASDLQRIVLARANQIILVSTPTLPSLRLARSLLQEIRNTRGGKSGGVDVLINKKGLDSASEIPSKDIAEALDLVPAAVIPFQPKVFMKAESEGSKLLRYKEGELLVKTHLLPLVEQFFSARTGPDSEKRSSTEILIGKILDGIGIKKILPKK
ncbi:MAG: AAA family ATPase [Alphaproteobacteria bacterium]|nr:AAA family ATPase [Alphaproteobacteria bacterium]